MVDKADAFLSDFGGVKGHAGSFGRAFEGVDKNNPDAGRLQRVPNTFVNREYGIEVVFPAPSPE